MEAVVVSRQEVLKSKRRDDGSANSSQYTTLTKHPRPHLKSLRQQPEQLHKTRNHAGSSAGEHCFASVTCSTSGWRCVSSRQGVKVGKENCKAQHFRSEANGSQSRCRSGRRRCALQAKRTGRSTRGAAMLQPRVLPWLFLL